MSIETSSFVRVTQAIDYSRTTLNSQYNMYEDRLLTGKSASVVLSIIGNKERHEDIFILHVVYFPQYLVLLRILSYCYISTRPDLTSFKVTAIT